MTDNFVCKCGHTVPQGTEVDEVLKHAISSAHYSALFVRRKLCFQCGKKMTMQIDSKTKKKSKYLWRCETCHPKGVMLSIG